MVIHNAICCQRHRWREKVGGFFRSYLIFSSLQTPSPSPLLLYTERVTYPESVCEKPVKNSEYVLLVNRPGMRYSLFPNFERKRNRLEQKGRIFPKTEGIDA